MNRHEKDMKWNVTFWRQMRDVLFSERKGLFLFPNPDEAEVLRAVRSPSLEVLGLQSKCCSVAIASMEV